MGFVYMFVYMGFLCVCVYGLGAISCFIFLL